MSVESILISKAAGDAGFDLNIGSVEGGWQGFGVSGSPTRVFVRCETNAFEVSVSSSSIAAELAESSVVGSSPNGEGAVWRAVTPEALRNLLRRMRLLDDALPNRLLDQFKVTLDGVDKTEREALVRQRVGQDLFRKGLMNYWDGRCAISGLAVPELLRASHAKPWKDCSDEERLDVHNGLLLAAHLDAAFDSGLIAVLPDGRVVSSGKLDSVALVILDLGHTSVVNGLKPAHAPYLAWHRERVFVP